MASLQPCIHRLYIRWLPPVPVPKPTGAHDHALYMYTAQAVLRETLEITMLEAKAIG